MRLVPDGAVVPVMMTAAPLVSPWLLARVSWVVATLETAMRFRDYKGIYPMHCHNVVHEDHGMMAMWKIV